MSPRATFLGVGMLLGLGIGAGGALIVDRYTRTDLAFFGDLRDADLVLVGLTRNEWLTRCADAQARVAAMNAGTRPDGDRQFEEYILKRCLAGPAKLHS